MNSFDPFALPAGSYNPMLLSDYDDSQTIDYDISLMKEMYPFLVRQILLEIEKECDKLEYAGSFMFDEIPDKTLVIMLCDKIYEKVAPTFSAAALPPGKPGPGHGGPGPKPGCKNHDCMPDGSPNWLSGLIHVLLCNEMCDRRRRYRRRRRVFMPSWR